MMALINGGGEDGIGGPKNPATAIDAYGFSAGAACSASGAPSFSGFQRSATRSIRPARVAETAVATPCQSTAASSSNAAAAINARTTFSGGRVILHRLQIIKRNRHCHFERIRVLQIAFDRRRFDRMRHPRRLQRPDKINKASVP